VLQSENAENHQRWADASFALGNHPPLVVVNALQSLGLLGFFVGYEHLDKFVVLASR
jgi:hypothetical protein